MYSPQPFALDEIRVCGTVFPQPTSSDRLYLDTTCFFGNIVDDVKVFISGQPVLFANPFGLQSDSYESLQVRYTDVVSIDFTSGSSVIQVTVNLSAPAIVAEAPMKTSGALTAMFDIHAEDINRFIEALRRRGLASFDPHCICCDMVSNQIVTRMFGFRVNASVLKTLFLLYLLT